MIVSPRKKPTTPVKVHLVHSAVADGSNNPEKPSVSIENKKSGDGKDVKLRSKKTPAKEALDNAVELSKEGKYLEAVQELDRALRLLPELSSNVRFYLNRGTYRFLAGMLNEALQDFDRAADIDDGIASLHFNRANVLKMLNRENEALGSYQRAAEIDPKLADAHAAIAQMLVRQKKFRRALAAASRALEINHRHYGALHARLAALAKLGQTLEAVETVHALIQHYHSASKTVGSVEAIPSQQRRTFAKILIHAAERLPFEDDRSLELTREAVQLDNNYDSCFEHANQLFSRGMYDEASLYYHKCAEQEPLEAEPHLLEGGSLVQLGEYERSLVPLRKAVKINDQLKEARFYLGLSFLNLGRFSEAIPQLRRVVDQNDQKNAEVDEIVEKARFLLASAYVHAGEEDQAYQLLKMAQQSSYSKYDPEVHFQAGYTASLLGKDQEAKQCFLECLRLNVKHLRAREALKNLQDKEAAISTRRPPSPPPLPPPPSVVVGENRVPLPALPPPSPPRNFNPKLETIKHLHSLVQPLSNVALQRQEQPGLVETLRRDADNRVSLVDDQVKLDVIRVEKDSAFGVQKEPQIQSKRQEIVFNNTSERDTLVPLNNEAQLSIKTATSPSGKPRSPDSGHGKPASSYRKLEQLGVISGAAAVKQLKSQSSSSDSSTPICSVPERSKNETIDIYQPRILSPSDSTIALAPNPLSLLLDTREDMKPSVIEKPSIVSVAEQQQGNERTDVSKATVISSKPPVPKRPPSGLLQKKVPERLLISSIESPLSKDIAKSGNATAGTPVLLPVATNLAGVSSEGHVFEHQDLNKNVICESDIPLTQASLSVSTGESKQVDQISLVRKQSDLSAKSLDDPLRGTPVNDIILEEHLVLIEKGALDTPGEVVREKGESINLVEGKVIETLPVSQRTGLKDSEQDDKSKFKPPIPEKRPVLRKSGSEKQSLLQKQSSSQKLSKTDHENPSLFPSSKSGALAAMSPGNNLLVQNNDSESHTLREKRSNFTNFHVESRIAAATSTESPPEKPLGLRGDLATVVKKLFGPPVGTSDDIVAVEKIFVQEGIQSVDDLKLYSTEELEQLFTLKRAWVKRITNYLQGESQRITPNVNKIENHSGKTPSFLTELRTFKQSDLRDGQGEIESPQVSPAQELLQTIQNFRRQELRHVEAPVIAIKKPTSDANGFLGTLVNAMRLRRVLIDDLDLDKPRRGSAISDTEKDDMFEADWS